MKLKLLFTGLVFSAVTANAQVSTINENFNDFTAGDTAAAFPQNGWSTVLATNPVPFPPAPVMVVTNAADKAIQSYSGNNSTMPSYLITPQIVTPTGNKTLKFTALKAASSNGTIEVGLASNPTDMSTFVSFGTVSLTTTTAQNVSIAVPASASTYIVFKFIPTSTHNLLQIDNVVYDLTANLAVTDNTKKSESIQFAVNSDNTALQFIGKNEIKNVTVFSATGHHVASGKVNNNSFDINTLQTGVYYVLIETNDGKAVKSKFIKK
ncbi:T9SS type A sorting domain-containing protein [Chryseobacterium sp. GP-SGM7]|uniref:T9SS type A sorting domain-containing protein n=1 Tax=Chryseobacterium sp. GP-SGM7 TaxID=3411323 RepID=UPI003B93BAC4